MSYTDALTGGPIQTNDQSYTALSLTSDVTLYWPIEGISGEAYVADLIDVTPTTTGLSITMPDARSGSLGAISLFNNRSGSYTFSVKDNSGATLLTAAPGTVWMLYMRTNSTAAGTWDTFQFGAQTASLNVASIAGNGLQAVSTALQQYLPITSVSSNFSITYADRANMYLWTGGGGTATLPSAADAAQGWFIYVRNFGSGSLALTPSAGNIDGAASKSLSSTTQAGCIVFCDGSNFYTITSNGSTSAASFDYTTVNIAGTGTYTLTGAELNRISYQLTGVLTGNRDVVVPNTVQQYWVNNQTTGAFTVTVKTAAGTGQTITQGGQAIVYCDGTNVVAGQSGITLPVAVASGGTGATTAPNALTNLGGSTVGKAIFQAVNAAAARSSLGSTSIGDAIFIAISPNGAITALSGSQVSINGNNQWEWLAATAGATLVVNAGAAQPAAYFRGSVGDNGRIAIDALGVREWWLYAANADGSFHIADFTGSLDAFKIATTGQASAYEPSFGVAALANVATRSIGSFTGTLTGMSAATTGTVEYRRTGSKVTLFVTADISGTSNATAMTLTGLPAACQPTSAQSGFCTATYDNGTGPNAAMYIVSGAVVNLYLGTSGYGTWTNSGTKGLMAGWSITYEVA